MALTTPQVKGNALEDAVRLIEGMILDTSPAAKNAVVTIERKKIVVVQGVKHEIDIYITIDNGRGYTSRFIFECKNWEDKVDKDEIIVFSRKVQDVRAQKGYFVARRFTKYAKAQAERDGIELLTADDVIDVLPPFLDTFHILGNNILNSAVKLTVISSDSEKIGFLPGYNSESFVRYGSEDLLLGKLIEKLQHEIVNEYTKHLPTGTFNEEKRRYEKTKTIGYQPGELFVEGLECQTLEIRVTWESQVIHPPIISKFDIKTRGRVITVGTDKHPLGGSMQISFISID
jgi:hypothetical protein